MTKLQERLTPPSGAASIPLALHRDEDRVLHIEFLLAVADDATHHLVMSCRVPAHRYI